MYIHLTVHVRLSFSAVEGSVVSVPQGSVVIAPRQKYVLDSEGHPVSDHRGRSITVDNDTIILQVPSSSREGVCTGSVIRSCVFIDVGVT